MTDRNPLGLTSGPGRLELLTLMLQLWLRGLRRRWRSRFPPRREVLDHAHPVLRLEGGRVRTVFRERLSCGHLLDLERRPRRRRPCWKCARLLPKDAGATPGSIFRHRYIEAPGVLVGSDPEPRR